MGDDESFRSFLRCVRSGDAQAAAELVRRYEPEIRREVRLRLTDPRLNRAFDSLDVCQSVLGSFFVRVALGEYDLDDARQLLKLLTTMARKKLAFRVRKERAQRRDYRRIEVLARHQPELAATGDDPQEAVAGQELLQEVRKRLTTDERHLADLRAEGRSWAEVAATLGGTPGARRKQLARAIDHILRDLGLEEKNID